MKKKVDCVHFCVSIDVGSHKNQSDQKVIVVPFDCDHISTAQHGYKIPVLNIKKNISYITNYTNYTMLTRQ